MLHGFEKIGPETAPVLVKEFLLCLQKDFYPPEDYEKVFGVEMVGLRCWDWKANIWCLANTLEE